MDEPGSPLECDSLLDRLMWGVLIGGVVLLLLAGLFLEPPDKSKGGNTKVEIITETREYVVSNPETGGHGVRREFTSDGEVWSAYSLEVGAWLYEKEMRNLLAAIEMVREQGK